MEIIQVKRSKNILKCNVEVDRFTEYASKAFDYDFTGESIFIPYRKLNVPEEYNIGVIYGSSGSGKSTLLKRFGVEEKIVWEDGKTIMSHFKNPKQATKRFGAVGLNSVPTWCKPYNVLSTGEKFRADLSRRIKNNAVIDEYTSVVNRSVAISASLALNRYVRKKDIKNIVISTCHEDVIEWLEPDWTFNTDTGELKIGRYLRQSKIELRIYKCKHGEWEMFKNHHYLSAELNKCCTCFICEWNGIKVAFNASIPLPGRIPPLYKGDTRNKYRESRTVVLPDYQGIGIGMAFSNAIGEYWLEQGYRYFSKTAHIKMGEYRQKSDLWRATSTNLKSREKSQKRSKNEAWHHMLLDTKRLCYSHEYIGQNNIIHRTKMGR